MVGDTSLVIIITVIPAHLLGMKCYYMNQVHSYDLGNNSVSRNDVHDFMWMNNFVACYVSDLIYGLFDFWHISYV